MNADLIPCKCLNKPRPNWVKDRIIPLGRRPHPDWPIFLPDYFDIIGHYWFKQTDREESTSYIKRCEKLYRVRLSDRFSEEQVVERVGLGLKSFTWAVVVREYQPKTFCQILKIVKHAEEHNRELRNASWSTVLFPGKKRASKLLIREYLSKVHWLRQSTRPPPGLITEANYLLVNCAREIEENFEHLQTVRERKQQTLNKVLANTQFVNRIRPFVFSDSLYRVRSYREYLLELERQSSSRT